MTNHLEDCVSKTAATLIANGDATKLSSLTDMMLIVARDHAARIFLSQFTIGWEQGYKPYTVAYDGCIVRFASEEEARQHVADLVKDAMAKAEALE